ncbi:MAG: NAD(P)-binding domain-containing protein [bacterium]
MKIGFIGQGWVGKAYADNFESRGFEVIRYDLEKYKANRELIRECGIVFIAVPTPTLHEKGQSLDAVRSALSCVAPGSIAVIRSTISPSATDELQVENQNIFLLHLPEFLREKHAARDVAWPERNIIGYTEKSKSKCDELIAVLARANHTIVMPAREAALVKYAGNGFLAMKVLFFNMLHDLCASYGADPEAVRAATVLDSRIGTSHTITVNGGLRGAGGHCFVKDLAALRKFVEDSGTKEAAEMLKASELFNIKLLKDSNNSPEEIKRTYGD